MPFASLLEWMSSVEIVQRLRKKFIGEVNDILDYKRSINTLICVNSEKSVFYLSSHMKILRFYQSLPPLVTLSLYQTLIITLKSIQRPLLMMLLNADVNPVLNACDA